MRVRIGRYRGSRGARELKEALISRGFDVKILKNSNSKYRYREGDALINWGIADESFWSFAPNPYSIMNHPLAVQNCSNKIRTFECLTENDLEGNIPKWTTSRGIAAGWIRDDYDVVYCRSLTSASQGRGIYIARTTEELRNAPLYTAEVNIDREIRVHVCDDAVIDFSQKKRMRRARLEEEQINLSENIRNHKNGWIFAREGVEIPEEAKTVAIAAVHCLALDFGAVDIGLTEQGVPIIFEVNSAPGLEGTTLEAYANAFEEILR